MSAYNPITLGQHAGKSWRRTRNYFFAAGTAVVPIVALELSEAVLSLPIGFMQDGPQYRPVAVLAPKPGHNLFVGPEGQWLGSYVPAALRFHPFRLLHQAGAAEETWVLCIHEQAQIQDEEEPTAEPFFDRDGNLAPATKAIFQWLSRLEHNRGVTDRAVAALAETGCLCPWPLKVKTGDGEQPVGGLYRVDEVRLGRLPDRDFLRLREHGALPVAYAHLLSMGQLRTLEAFAKLHAEVQRLRTADAALKGGAPTDRFFLPADAGSIAFE